MNNDLPIIKIDENYLLNINKQFDASDENIYKYFGNWIYNIKELNKTFIFGKPYENIVIDNFLSEQYADKIYRDFPTQYEDWYKYLNPIEFKYTFDNIENLTEEIKKYFYILSSNRFIEFITKLTGIKNLEQDPYLHGAGLHCHTTNGKLDIHLDYEKHPYSGKERRINIILFISKDWEPTWNGANELWDENVTSCIKKTDIKFNRAIIFKTNDISWHGVPDKIICPEFVYRKSLAYYYVSSLNTNKKEEEYRKKAKYVKRPTDEPNENIEKLYKIRSDRRITSEDLCQYFPQWKVDK